MRANVSVGTAGETILEHGFEQKIAEPRHAGPTLHVGLTMRSEIEAISSLVDLQDEGNGFDPGKIPDPTAHISV